MSFLPSQSFNNLVTVNTKDSRTIVFIDSSIANGDGIAQKVAVEARVIMIGSEDDGVKEISKILADSNCLEIHIFSSGFPGCIYLGNSKLSCHTLANYSLEIGKWFITHNSLHSVKLPRLFIYGWDLAIGDAGEELIDKLSLITGAKISTSNNIVESNIFSY
ncbi:DUF4347 domain-containing protein [Waterburya agarophytonicola K14]|uniref:DUF4347 domain-containing protein n=1 Tax=Waterburya agarophytonicola KI4 TaxID=2874699 RepID=A0A964BPN1_9CYAN|nr:DUF4347 domain-containing protein [Waterburya agarophytonicola]MCC0177288.1 DUF4347 domain-containing protein [Waterburya agarophytonicola KI4]